MCSYTSEDEMKAKVHLKMVHGVQVHTEDVIDSFSCAQCSFIHEDMGEMRKHMIVSHQKNETNWGLEIKIKFDCKECDYEFASKAMLRSHVDSGHSEVKGIVIKDVNISTSVKIESVEVDINTKRIWCNLCNLEFSNELMLMQHSESYHRLTQNNDAQKFKCNECDITFPRKYMLIQHNKNGHKENNSQNLKNIQTEKHQEKIHLDYTVEEYPEKKKKGPSVYGEEEDKPYQGFKMQGISQAYKDAHTALRTKLVKGAVFTDSKGSTLTILNVPKVKNQAIVVEVTTLNEKKNEEIGKAKLTMYEPTPKKKATLTVSMFSGFPYSIAKTVMEEFIKPFIDSLISDPNEDPMRKYMVSNDIEVF